MQDKPLALWKDIERLVEGCRIDKERVAANGYGSTTSLGNLRRAANDLRLRSEHFRAITNPGLTDDQFIDIDAIHEKRWAKRRGKGKS